MASLKLVGYRPSNNVQHNSHDIYHPNRGLGPLKPSIREIPVGGIAHIGGKRYRVIEAERRANCYGCCFILGGVCQKGKDIPCSAYSRSDQTWVIFKEINKDGSLK